MHVLGIDAGGTKTVCLLADDRGTVLSEARGRGANLQASGMPVTPLPPGAPAIGTYQIGVIVPMKTGCN